MAVIWEISCYVESKSHPKNALIMLVLLISNFQWWTKIPLRCRRNTAIFGHFDGYGPKIRFCIYGSTMMHIFKLIFIVSDCVMPSCNNPSSLVAIHQVLGLPCTRNVDFLSDTLQHSNVAKCHPHFCMQIDECM